MKYTETIAHSMRKEIQKGIAVETVLQKTQEVLREHKQELFLSGALKKLVLLLKKDMEFEKLHIKSAFGLEQVTVKAITRIVTGSEERAPTLSTDKGLLAGFVATYKGKIYDGSAFKYITKIGKQ